MHKVKGLTNRKKGDARKTRRGACQLVQQAADAAAQCCSATCACSGPNSERRLAGDADVERVLQLIVVHEPVQLLPRIVVANLVPFLAYNLACFLCLLSLASLALAALRSQCFAPRLLQ